jgi:hypothetical protein
MSDAYRKFTFNAHIPPTFFDEVVARMHRVLDTEATFWVRSPQGAFAAFSIILKDLGPAIAATHGQDNWWARLRALPHLRPSRAVIYQAGIAPREAIRAGRMGLSIGRAGLVHSLDRILAQSRYCESVISLIDEAALNRHYTDGFRTSEVDYWVLAKDSSHRADE